MKKVFDIIFFVAATVALTWLAVFLVQQIPRGIEALVSMSDRVYQPTPPRAQLTVRVTPERIDSGGDVMLFWNNASDGRAYYLSFSCEDGVIVTPRTNDGSFGDPYDCGERHELSSEVRSIELRLASPVQRVADLSFTVAVLHERGQIDLSDSVDVTILNERVEIVEEEILEEEDEEEEIIEDVATTTPPVVTQPPIYYEYVPVYTTPVSDPYGYTDLSVTLIGFGTMLGDGSYISQTFVRDDVGAVQFEVKNIGTKTSDYFEYEVILPSGERYTRERQAPLKPNERAVITMSFSMEDIYIERRREYAYGTIPFEIRVYSTGDVNAHNNTYLGSFSVWW